VNLGGYWSIVYLKISVAGQPTWRWFHLGRSLGYPVTNIDHMVADILIADAHADHVLLMAVMAVIDLLINRESLLWCQVR